MPIFTYEGAESAMRTFLKKELSTIIEEAANTAADTAAKEVKARVLALATRVAINVEKNSRSPYGDKLDVHVFIKDDSKPTP